MGQASPSPSLIPSCVSVPNEHRGGADLRLYRKAPGCSCGLVPGPMVMNVDTLPLPPWGSHRRGQPTCVTPPHPLARREAHDDLHAFQTHMSLDSVVLDGAWNFVFFTRCQGLPGAARGCQGLPGAARSRDHTVSGKNHRRISNPRELSQTCVTAAVACLGQPWSKVTSAP